MRWQIITKKKQTKLTKKPASVDLTAKLNAAKLKEAAANHIVMESAEHLTINGQDYALVANYHDGFDKEKLAVRFSDILFKYDYIVGDWGYEQLRLKGFYAENNKRAHRDQLINTLQDYLYEYCNFGCAYFVLQRLGAPKHESRPAKHHRSHLSRGQHDRAVTKKKEHHTAKKAGRKRHFTIKRQQTMNKVH
ncbi:hypothetical protein FC24_GL001330 [Loigolactobacillus rennini DSM 20253]|uniref:Transcriptional regulator n=1 Tax=Loigolactobacillus rennini DSM 20253 TaxID=1423796 RepID=A0A0R2D3B9_9LACO|nr:hypothetical protein FC24_GL001330 [Loigolactobacillus rennini DSM 20253]